MKKDMESYYDKIVKIYDLMYNKKTGFDHKAQVKWVDGWRKKLGLAKTNLDLACGTGKHLRHFHKLGYKCIGIDASAEMLKIAKKENKKIGFQKGYFHSFKLRSKVPIITSFFNSMSHNVGEKSMVFSLRNVRCNLESGGIFVFDIFCSPSTPRNIFLVKEFKEKNIYLSRTFIGVPVTKGFKSIIYYVIFDGKKSEIIEETMLRGVYSEPKMISMLKKSGFKVLYSGEGYSKGSAVFVAQN